eukprot:scaffold2842_cov60-Phaeocystis_antarctica.AAC.1
MASPAHGPPRRTEGWHEKRRVAPRPPRTHAAPGLGRRPCRRTLPARAPSGMLSSPARSPAPGPPARSAPSSQDSPSPPCPSS